MRFPDWAEPIPTFFAALTGRSGRRYMSRAGTAQLDGDWDAAIDYATRAIASQQLSDDNLYHALRLRGETRATLGQHELALKDFDAAVRTRPDYPAGYMSRGLAHAALGNDEAAIADYTRMLDKHPNHGHTLRQRAISFSRLGRHDEAAADHERASARDPHSDDLLMPVGMPAASPAEHRRILDELRAAMRREPGNGLHYLERGRLQEAQGAIGGAVGDYATAIGLLTYDAEALQKRAHKMARKGRHEEAREIMQKAEELMEIAARLLGRLKEFGQ